VGYGRNAAAEDIDSPTIAVRGTLVQGSGSPKVLGV